MTAETRALAEWICSVPPEHTETVFTRATRSALDLFGTLVAGASDDAVSLVGDTFGVTTRQPVVSAKAAGPARAALVNGIAAHVMDYDDWHYPGGHVSSVIFPAALAVAEVTGADGRQLLDAYVVGVEVMAKLGKALGLVHYRKGWHTTSTAGSLGAAASTARLMGLSVDETVQALGIAGTLAGGSRQSFGTMSKSLHAGVAAARGITAAQLAKVGFTGSPEILEGGYGMFALMSDPERLLGLTDQLGSPFEMVDPGLALKRYPCCGASHQSLDAAEDARIELFGAVAPVDPDEITAVTVRVPKADLIALIYHQPATALEGKFSLEYPVAAMVVDGAVTLRTFTDEAVRRDDLRRVAARVVIHALPAATEDQALGSAPVEVEVTTANAVASAVCLDTKGSPRRPLTLDQVVAKWVDCAVGVFDGSPAAAQFANEVVALDQVPDVGGWLAERFS